MSKINPYKTLVYLLVIYMFTTLTYTLWIVSSPNKIIGFLIFCNVFWLYCKHITTKKVIILLFSLTPIGWSLLFSNNILNYLSDGIYLLVTIFLIVELNNNYFLNAMFLALNQLEKFVKRAIFLCDFVLIAGFFDSRCYNSSQWDGTYYIGYTNASHTMAAGACLLLIFSLCIIKNKKNLMDFIIFLPSIVAILKSGARTFLIPVIVVCCFFYIYHIKKKSVKLSILPIAIGGSIYVFLNSSMIKKFAFSINNQFTDMNFLGRFTNGRTVFWITDLLAFFKYDIIQKLFGNGFDYVYMINKENFNLAIWAHNDIINSLLSAGIIGTGVYIYVVSIICIDIIKNGNNFLIKFLLLIYIIVPALLNGFYAYQHYVYSFFILIILYKKYYNKNKIWRKFK